MHRGLGGTGTGAPRWSSSAPEKVCSAAVAACERDCSLVRPYTLRRSGATTSARKYISAKLAESPTTGISFQGAICPDGIPNIAEGIGSHCIGFTRMTLRGLKELKETQAPSRFRPWRAPGLVLRLSRRGIAVSFLSPLQSKSACSHLCFFSPRPFFQ